MSEILFIANDQKILTFMKRLQPLVALSIAHEVDYSSGIKRIFDEHPSIILLQGKIDDVSCDRAANQVKMLLDNEDIRLVLLSDDLATSDSLASAFDSCLDMNLSFDELSRQVQQLLNTLPSLAWSTSAAAVPSAFRSEITELSPQDRLEPFGPFPPASEDGWSGELVAASDVHAKALEALQRNEPLGSEVPVSAEGLDTQFLDFFLCNQLDGESLKGELGSGSLPEQPVPPEASATSTVAAPVKHLLDFYQAEEENPDQRLDDLAGAPDEPGYPEPGYHEPGCSEPGCSEPGESQPSGEDTPAPASARQIIQGEDEDASSTGSDRATGNSATAETKEAPPIIEVASDAVSLGIVPARRDGRLNRGVVISLLLVLCMASIAAVLWYNGASSTNVSKGLDLPAPLPAPSSSTMQQLPLFMPRVAPDATYGVSHPGWESYHADALRYLVYREKGRIRAIQVLSEGYGSISLAFLKTCIRIASGDELSSIKTTEARDELQVVTGALQNGGEIVIYRSIADGEIRGFVLTFPASPSPP